MRTSLCIISPAVVILSVAFGGSLRAEFAETPQQAAARGVFQEPYVLVQHVTNSSSRIVQAVLTATRLARSKTLVTTGTVTEFAPGTTIAMYKAEPRDRLRVVLSDQSTFDVVITTMRGNLTSNAKDFLMEDHEFAARITIPKKIDLTLTSRRKRRSPIAFDGTFEVTAKGAYFDDSAKRTVDAKGQGTYYFETDSTGTEYRNNMRYTGTISTAAATFDINESWQHQHVATDGRSAITSVRTINSRWMVGDVTYQCKNGLIKTYHNEAGAAPSAFWHASGSLFVGPSKSYGQLKLTRGAGAGRSRYAVVLQLPGRSIELQFWLCYARR